MAKYSDLDSDTLCEFAEMAERSYRESQGNAVAVKPTGGGDLWPQDLMDTSSVADNPVKNALDDMDARMRNEESCSTAGCSLPESRNEVLDVSMDVMCSNGGHIGFSDKGLTVNGSNMEYDIAHWCQSKPSVDSICSGRVIVGELGSDWTIDDGRVEESERESKTEGLPSTDTTAERRVDGCARRDWLGGEGADVEVAKVEGKSGEIAEVSENNSAGDLHDCNVENSDAGVRITDRTADDGSATFWNGADAVSDTVKVEGKDRPISDEAKVSAFPPGDAESRSDLISGVGCPPTEKPGVSKNPVQLEKKLPHLSFSPDVLLVAPTGKAANVLGRRTGIQAFTLHQVISYA